MINIETNIMPCNRKHHCNTRSVFAALMYLESQGIMNIHRDKLQTISNSILSTITTTNATTTTGRGGVSIPAILSNNTRATASAILPMTTTATLANLSIPLTGSTATGFTIGLIKC
jgi:hypothetical protein